MLATLVDQVSLPTCITTDCTEDVAGEFPSGSSINQSQVLVNSLETLDIHRVQGADPSYLVTNRSTDYITRSSPGTNLSLKKGKVMLIAKSL